MCGKRSPKMKIAGNLRFFFSLFVGSQGIYVGIGYMSRNPYYLQIQYVLQTVCFVCFFAEIHYLLLSTILSQLTV